MDLDSAGGLALFVAVVVATCLGPERLGRLRRAVGRFADRVLVAAEVRRPPLRYARPIENIARDAHRLGLRFRYLHEGASFAQVEGCRRAYDLVLAEACQSLEVEHLLAVFPPGPDLDQERHRVEVVLNWAGLPLDDVA